MEKVFLWIGVLFALIGALFTVLFTAVAIASGEWALLVGGLVGLVFLCLGVGFLVHRSRHQKRRRFLLESGQRIYADITEVTYDTRVRFNGRCPFVILCQAIEPRSGQVYVFESESLWFDPAPYLHNVTRLPVYVDPENYRHYTVDTSGILPEQAR